MPFSLHPTLAQDTIEVARLPLCRVLLMKDGRFPWLILVPERESAREICELAAGDRGALIEEVTQASEVLRGLFRPDKLNVGALGNVVPQLHVHVVARFAADPAWPGPVWGSGAAVAYPPGELEEIRERLAAAFSGEPRIRRAGLADVPDLAELAARTFAETFGDDTAPEDLAAFLAASYGIRQQTEELKNPEVVTLVAESGGRLVAYAQLRRQTPPACVTGEEPVELRRFYVDRPWQGSGIAKRLMATAYAAAHELGGRCVWLSVWERNPRAIAFYGKCGFRDVGSNDFWVGSDRQTDRILVAEALSEPLPAS